MLSIRSAIDRFLREPPNSKLFSITAHPAFTKANKVLDAFVKSLRKSGKIAGTVHRESMTEEHIQQLFESVELGPADSKDPVQFMKTAWLYICIFSRKRGRENQRALHPNILILRKTPQGQDYYQLNTEMPGALPADKNHPGGLTDPEDESDGKIFAVDGSPRCPVQTVKAYLSHLNPVLDVLLQKPRHHCSSFNPDKEPVRFCNSSVGQSTLENMLKEMSKKAGIVPHLTNQRLRATSITILSDADCESRHTASDLSQGTSRTKQSSHTTTGRHFGSSEECRKCWAAFSPPIAKKMEILMWMPCK